MRLTFNPIEAVLEKGKALPIGTRRKYGDFWFKKRPDGTWAYDGSVAHKGIDAGDSTLASSAPVSVFGSRMAALSPLSGGEVEALKKSTVKRDRFSDGQRVRYMGKGSPNYHGQIGTLVAMGVGGSAVVQMGDGRNIKSRWLNLEPQGVVKPYSLYDGLEEGQIFRCSGDVAKDVQKILDQPIGSSGITYGALCRKFKEKGFSLIIVGGTVRDIMSGKDANDVDFIVDCSDGELEETVREIKPKWADTAIKNAHLGLVSFTDGKDVVDITPVHKYSDDIGGMAKGWNLIDDAKARDFAMNSLHFDPLEGVLIDGTARGLRDIGAGVIDYCDTSYLKGVPRYVLRAFKFLGRGYKPTEATETAIRNNLDSVMSISPRRRQSFLERQIYEKDGQAGLEHFKAVFQKYDTGNYWRQGFESLYKNVSQGVRASANVVPRKRKAHRR